MFDKDVIEKFSERFRYRDTPWYKGLFDAVSLQKRKVLIASYFAGILIPCAFLASDLLRGDTSHLVNYLVPISVLFIMEMIIVAAVPRKIRPGNIHRGLPRAKTGPAARLFGIRDGKISIDTVSLVTMAIAFAGYFLAAYLPGSRQVAIFIAIVFIPFAFLLNGARRGTVWSVMFLVCVVGTRLLAGFGVLPRTSNELADSQVFMMLLGGVFILGLLYVGQKQQERIFGELIRHLLFDRDTGLPNKEVMLKSYPENEPFLLVIVQIQNFRELTSLFGYDMSERILMSSATAVEEI